MLRLNRRYRSGFRILLCMIFAVVLQAAMQAQESPVAQRPDALAAILAKKGILTPDEAKRIEQAATPGEANAELTQILLKKGVLTEADLQPAASAQPVATPQAASAPPPAAQKPHEPAGAPFFRAQSLPNPTEPGAPSVVEKPHLGPLQSLAPIRALPVGGVPRNATTPAFLAEGVGMTPYGFIKATAIEDSSSPNGDDFPLPGFLADTGPDGAPEFHVKARSTRFGANFVWYDASPKWSINGRIEMDFEGNFNRSDNRNLSSVRSSNPSVRLAWARLDYTANPKNVYSALFGQDWTPFASSTLPNMLETTGLGIGFGTLYERTPQMRMGYTHKFTNFQLMPEFAITLPASGLPPSAANISEQLGYGERQGPDSNRPQLEGRLAGQFQLDHAAGVPPAQWIVSMEQGSRTATVLASAIPAAYQQTFATGVTGSSHTAGWDLEWQLPTRYVTLIGKFYSGSDLRFFFAGQLYSFFNDAAGLTNTVDVASEDGSSTVVLGTNASGQQVVAPERPVRAEGGFAQLGLPLSRIFGARPTGRNAGWSLYALYGVDQAKTRDLDHLGPSGNRRYSTMAVGTLNYSLNRWVSFSFEESIYTTHANPDEPLPLFRGVSSREWNDVREEFGPIFIF